MARLGVRLAVAALVAAAVGLGVPGPAQAATCRTAQGVSVVVDFHQLAGGVPTACDRGGAGETAAEQFEDVGHVLTRVQTQPGFVCRVDGKPASDPCHNTPPADAYWSLWWSDGKSGTWRFASEGVDSLKVPEGGYVALSWQGGDAKAPPRAAPTAHESSSPSPSPSASPSDHPSSSQNPGPTPSPSSPSSVPPSSPTADGTASSAPRAASSAGRSDHHSGKHHAKASKHPDHARDSSGPGTRQSAQALPATLPRSDSGASGSGGVPGWVPPVAIVALLVGAGTVALARRRRGGA